MHQGQLAFVPSMSAQPPDSVFAPRVAMQPTIVVDVVSDPN